MARKDTTALKPATLNSATRSTESMPSDERVRTRAYEIYNERCHSGVYGDATEGWIAAERQLQARYDVDQEPAVVAAAFMWAGYV